MLPDLERYRRHVDRFDLSEEQKVELIHTVWAIMESFVDRAFGLDPTQQVAQPEPLRNSIGAPDRIDSGDQILEDHFEHAAGDPAAEES